jgi:UDP-N-acetylglucosamine 2-epimerase (non-hydrolysing)
MTPIKLKVAIVVGTRPEIIRLSSLIRKLDKYCELILIHTGQNYDYELNQIFFTDMKLRSPDYLLNCAAENGAKTIGRVICEVDQVLEKERPDALLVLGDTNSCLAVLPAKRRKIPIFHMEAGNRCFDMRVPEEINRRIVDHTSDVNLTYSDIARNYLLREGLHPDLVITTGSPMREVLNEHMKDIESSDILTDLGLQPYKYFLVSAHREENIELEHNFLKLLEVINIVAKKYNLPVILSAHPRTRNRIESARVSFNPNVKIMKPMGFLAYNKLQLKAKVVLSDSGTISEESSILNFPALNIRESHERPEAMEEGSVMMVGLNIDRIDQAISILADQARNGDRTLSPVKSYSSSNVSDKVLRIIHSYTDYVNHVVWKKY